jgi:hypothetical protein
MFSILPVLSIALVVASTTSGLILPRHRAINLARSDSAVSQPANYATPYLEVSTATISPSRGIDTVTL